MAARQRGSRSACLPPARRPVSPLKLAPLQRPRAYLSHTKERTHSDVFTGTTYYISVVAGLVISLGVITATLPLLSRITGSEAARNE
jgi:hypothetical protein